MSRVQPFNLSEVHRSGRPEEHPWIEWFDGRTHELIRGEDYEADSPKSFRSTVYSAARRYGVKVDTKIIDGNLNVQRVAIIDPDLYEKRGGKIEAESNGTRKKVAVRRKD